MMVDPARRARGGRVPRRAQVRRRQPVPRACGPPAGPIYRSHGLELPAPPTVRRAHVGARTRLLRQPGPILAAVAGLQAEPPAGARADATGPHGRPRGVPRMSRQSAQPRVRGNDVADAPAPGDRRLGAAGCPSAWSSRPTRPQRRCPTAGRPRRPDLPGPPPPGGRRRRRQPRRPVRQLPERAPREHAACCAPRVAGAARNACRQGAEFADGDVIHWLDADMLLAPRRGRGAAALAPPDRLRRGARAQAVRGPAPTGIAVVHDAFERSGPAGPATMFDGRWTADRTTGSRSSSPSTTT